jgi:hypothetical protein
MERIRTLVEETWNSLPRERLLSKDRIVGKVMECAQTRASLAQNFDHWQHWIAHNPPSSVAIAGTLRIVALYALSHVSPTLLANICWECA